MTDKEQIQENLHLIHQRMHAACIKAGRAPESVRLLMATKTVSADRIRLAVESGESLIGENKVQEYDAKYADTLDLVVERHFIGHLQTNKVKDIIQYVTCIQSVDRLELAEKLQNRLEYEDKQMNIYVEVNTSGEESKSGVAPSEAITVLQKISLLNRIHIKGLMTIGIASADEMEVRSCFKKLVVIRDAAQKLGLLPEFCELSMGMSQDLEWAIAEGSTIVRVGSAIFGHRNYA